MIMQKKYNLTRNIICRISVPSKSSKLDLCVFRTLSMGDSCSFGIFRVCAEVIVLNSMMMQKGVCFG